jgi:hypothetical protein
MRRSAARRGATRRGALPLALQPKRLLVVLGVVVAEHVDCGGTSWPTNSI